MTRKTANGIASGARQDAYLASSKVVTLAEVEAWPASRRLWNNTVAMLGPHPGKVVGSACNIGWGGKEQVLTSFEVLLTP